MAVQEQTPYIEHVANGVTTSFALGFVCDSADKLVVTVNDLPTNVGDWSFIEGSVIFQYPPLSESIIKIWRNSPLARSTTFKTYDNSLNPNSLNFDLDKIWLVMQELNVKNSFSDNKLQTLLDSLIAGNVNGLPAEILARIAGDELTIHSINLEASRAYIAEQQLSTQILVESDKSYQNLQTEKERAKQAEQNLQLQINAAGVGNKAYKTYALMDADKTNIPAKSKVTVTNDATASNNGDWQWDGTVFTKSTYDPLTQANTYTDDQVMFIANSVSLKKSTDPTIIPILADSTGKALVYYDTVDDKFVAGGLLESIFGLISQLKTYEDDRYISVLTDAKGKILIGWDKHSDSPIGIESQNSTEKNYKYFAQKPLVQEINHILSYGQSLSMGATATAILSTMQMYYNLTFNTGPRQDSTATSVIPLIELFNNPSADGYANRGETHCSGMANYASRAMMLEDGVNPQDHVIFASTAGHGGYTIDQLKKGSAWYSIFIDHVNKAKSLNVGKSYHVPVVPWIQGENNAVSGGLQTPYEVYKAGLIQLQSDANADIKAITGQVDPVRFITYQMSYAARTWPDIAKAQLDLARENDNFMLATPMYHFPYAGDNIHLTNMGYKWMGAYFGRAYKQYMIEGRKPDFINPLSAHIEDDKIYIHFDVPTLPLQLDALSLASTVNSGFKVMNGVNEVAINSVVASNDRVILHLASSPTTAVQVRYALDYLGTGLSITGGASGNLRDSTSDLIVISGTEKPLYHVCPHFELTAFLDKGI